MTQADLQIAEFEPQTVYDAPETLFSMLVDGELSAANAADTLFRPDRLTLKERTGLRERLQSGLGGTRVGNALVDIGTNPWVWAALVFSPAGSKALSRGQRIFTIHEKFTPFQREHGGLLASLGLLGPDQQLRGTSTMDVVHQVADERKRLGQEFQAFTEAAEQAVLKKAGLRTLDPQRFATLRHTADQNARAERIALIVQGHLEGWEKSFRQVIDDGSEQLVKPMLREGSLRREAANLGIADEVDQYVASLQQGMRRRLIRVYGKETDDLLARGEFVADPEKVGSILRGAKRNVLKTSAAEEDFIEQLEAYLGNDMTAKIRAGDVGEDAVLEKLQDVFQRQIQEDGIYFPRKIRETIDEQGRIVQPGNLGRVEFRKPLSSTAAAAQRSEAVASYHPDDFERMREIFGEGNLTNEWRRRLIAAEKSREAAFEAGQEATFFRMRPMDAMNRYLQDTDNAYAWYVAAPDELVEDAVREARVNGSPARTDAGVGSRRSSLMDIMADEYDAFTDQGARDTLSQVVLPMVSGKHQLKHLFSVQALISTKQVVGDFADSGLGRIMEDSGDLGKRTIEGMRRFSKVEMGKNITREATRNTRGLANLLYSSHLGVNMGSVMLNLSQPFLLAVPFLTNNPAHVTRAYGKAFKEFFGYMDERLRQGFRHLDDVEKTDLINKHFEDAEFLGITPDVFHAVDEVENIRLRGPGGAFDRTLELLMKPFEKGEWMNRIVSRNLVKEAWRGAGRADEVGGAAFRRDVRETVVGTQFGGSRLNAPTAFLTDDASIGGPISPITSNPLARQFLQFVTRSFTGVFETGAKLGGTSSRAEGVARTFARGMGISAAINAVTRDIVGVDYERGLFFSATTELVSGEERFQGQPNPVRLPPVADIPFDIITGVAAGDAQLIGSAAARLVPGGVAAQRLLRAAPKLPDIPWVDLQRTHVDWNAQTEDGRVPVFRSDGALIDYKTPADIVLGALGADLGRFNSPSDLDGFLVKQNDLIREIRGRAVVALRSGDIDKYQRIKGEYEQRFGLPMTISSQQLERSVKTAETPRTERILDMLPREAREAFMGAVARSQFADGTRRFGITEEQFLGGETASQRAEGRPETVNREDFGRGRDVVSGDAERATEDEGFSAFEGF